MIKKDILIGCIANYTPDKITEYINSVNECGFTGDKVMICYNLPNETIEYLDKNGWTCYGGELNGHPHMQRLIDIWYILQNSKTEYRFLITTDVRDVVFQTNPSEFLEELYYYGDRESGWHDKTGVIIASERLNYNQQEWNVKNIHEGYGPIFWDWIKDKEIGNVGVMLGKYDEMKNLLMLNWLVSQAGNTQHFTDQSSLNLIIHNKLISDKIKIDNNIALQVGTLNEELDIRDGIVYNTKTGKPYPIVHQWDRNETLTKLFKNKQ